MQVNTKVIHTSDGITVMETMGARLKRLREAKGLSQGELAKRAGLKSQGAIGNIERDIRGYGASIIDIARELGTTPDYLRLADSGSDTAKTFDANAKAVPHGVRRFPVISAIQAGHLKEITDPYGPGDGFDVEFGDDDASPWAFFLQIEGDSMLDEFKPGDRVQIDPEVAPRPGDFVAAKNSKQEATFKKYRVRGIDANGDEVFELVPLNDNYPIMRSDEHKLSVIGTMIEHRRKFRRK